MHFAIFLRNRLQILKISLASGGSAPRTPYEADPLKCSPQNRNPGGTAAISPGLNNHYTLQLQSGFLIITRNFCGPWNLYIANVFLNTVSQIWKDVEIRTEGVLLVGMLINFPKIWWIFAWISIICSTSAFIRRREIFNWKVLYHSSAPIRGIEIQNHLVVPSPQPHEIDSKI